MNTDVSFPGERSGCSGSKRVIVWLALLLTLALGLRVATIAARGDLWADETITGMLIQHGPADLIGRLAVPTDVGATTVHVHPPAYYLMLDVWAGVFGDGSRSLRSFSAMFGVFSVGLLWFLLRKFFDSNLAGLGATAAAFSAVQVYYSSEARYYALFLFLTLASLYFFLDIVRNHRGFVPYAVVNILCMYTFYYGVFVILSENVLFLATGGWRDRRQLGHWVLAQVAVVLAFLPWVPVLLRHRGAFRGIDFSSWSEYLSIMKAPLLELMAFGGSGQLELVAMGAFGLLVFLALFSRSSRDIRTAAFWLAWIVIPLVAHRYTGTLVLRTRAFIFLAPAIGVLAAQPLAFQLKAGRRGRALIAGFLFVVFLGANFGATVQTWQRTRTERSAHPSLVHLDEQLSHAAGSRSALILNRGKLIPLVGCYVDQPIPIIGFWANPGKDRSAHVMGSLGRLADAFDEFWLVSYRGKGQPPWSDLVASKAPEASRYDYQYLSVQRVESDIFRPNDSEEAADGMNISDTTLPQLVLLGPEDDFNQTVEVPKPTNLQIDVLTKFPAKRPFHGLLEMNVDGRQVAAKKIGSDFLSLYRLETVINPGSHDISLAIRNPTP